MKLHLNQSRSLVNKKLHNVVVFSCKCKCDKKINLPVAKKNPCTILIKTTEKALQNRQAFRSRLKQCGLAADRLPGRIELHVWGPAEKIAIAELCVQTRHFEQVSGYTDIIAIRCRNPLIPLLEFFLSVTISKLFRFFFIWLEFLSLLDKV